MGVTDKLGTVGRNLSTKVSSASSSFIVKVEQKVRAPSAASRTAQIFAVVLLPCVVPVYMGVSAAIYLTMVSLLTGIGVLGDAFTSFLCFLIGMGLVVGGMVVLFKWVQTGGFGYLET